LFDCVLTLLFSIFATLTGVRISSFIAHVVYLRIMTRRNRRSRKGGKSRAKNTIGGIDRVLNVPGKFLLPVNILAGGTLGILLSDSAFGARLSTLGTTFQEHRYNSISLRLHPGYTNAGQNVRTSYVVAYYKVPPTAVTNNAQLVYQGVVSRYHDSSDTLPLVFSLPRRELYGGPRQWYLNGTPSGSEDLDRSQGMILIIPNSTTTGLNTMLEVSYSVLLRGPTTPSLD